MLKRSVEEILWSHTEGQLYCMAVASRIQNETMKRRMKTDQPTTRGEAASFGHRPESVKLKKPVSQMTKAEQEAYYLTAGA